MVKSANRQDVTLVQAGASPAGHPNPCYNGDVR